MSRTRRRAVLIGGVCAPLVALGAWSGGAGASGTAEHPLSVLPNPAFVGDRLIAGGGQSPETACEGDLVALAVTRSSEEVFAQDAEPNSTGGWAIELPRLEAATYRVTATCSREGAQVFAYDPTTLVVQAPEPPAEPSPEPSAEPSVEASAEPAPPATPVPGAPTFTG
jgi:hypothetical protein